MPIYGVTDQISPAILETGKPTRIGWLQKGRREGFGKQIKLYDDDHFHFKPSDAKNGAALARLFKEVYGEKPDSIQDVRLPVDIAGNFDINQLAWLTARKHTERGSTFLAQSDGRHINRMRNEETGRIDRYADGELEHEAVSRMVKGESCFVYKDKTYPWTKEMQIDLILKEFNDAIYARRLGGYGVVTLILHGEYDIPNMIKEYYQILNYLSDVMSNPFKSGDKDTAMRYMPLRRIPLRLFRRWDKTTTPNWRNGDAGDRLNSTHSLVHWEVGPEFSAAAQQALDDTTRHTLAAVAQRPMITVNGRTEQQKLDDLNELLFDAPPALPATVAQVVEPETETAVPSTGPQWQEFTDDLPADDVSDGEFEDAAEEPVAYDWKAQAENASHIDDFAYAWFQLSKQSPVCFYDDSNHVKRGIEYMCPKAAFAPGRNGLVMQALKKYEQSIADDTKPKAAANAVKKWFTAEYPAFVRALDEAETAVEEEE
ncbi:MAG: hypothetical protein KDC32_25470 [Saprospiraceae bacterium]|nr:hypothetical protein [Saprospiraceae bacterium]